MATKTARITQTRAAATTATATTISNGHNDDLNNVFTDHHNKIHNDDRDDYYCNNRNSCNN